MEKNIKNYYSNQTYLKIKQAQRYVLNEFFRNVFRIKFGSKLEL